MAKIDKILERIDHVLRENRRLEHIYIGMTIALFGVGISCCLGALFSGQYLLALPPAFTTAFLFYPMQKIEALRKQNIALQTAPVLIDSLPLDKAAEEMVRLLTSLHGNSNTTPSSLPPPDGETR